MAMMIVKFHKLIQSKVLWYIVLGVIIISFVGFFTPTMGSKSSTTNDAALGELFGEKVTQREFRKTAFSMSLMYLLSTGEELRQTPEFDKQVWTQLALLRKAAEEDVRVTDTEVVRNIQGIPAFQNEAGSFEKQRYEVILQRLGVAKAQLEQVVREQIAVQKLIFRSVQSALISPQELERAYHIYTDRIVLDYAVLSREDVAKEVSVLEEDAKAYFESNTEEFRMPAKVQVSYVEFLVDDFLAEAEVVEGQALQIYNQNLEAYRVENEDPSAPVEYKTFDEVEAEITEQLKTYAARNLAVEQATSLVAAIAPKAQGEVPDFKGAVAAAGLNVKTLPAFGPDDELAGIDETSPFKAAALGLQPDEYSSFSDAVVGRDSVYVISLEKRHPSFLPSYSAVTKEAAEAAKAKAVAEKIEARQQEISTAVSEALAAGTDFKTAMAPYGLTIESTEEFDLTSELDNEYADILIPISISVAQGDLCEVVPVEQGALIAYVAQRTSMDVEAGLPLVRDDIISGFAGERSQRMAKDWQDKLMLEADLKIFEK